MYFECRVDKWTRGQLLCVRRACPLDCPLKNHYGDLKQMEQKVNKTPRYLRPKQLALVSELVKGSSLSAACRTVGISRTQGSRWTSPPHPVHAFMREHLADAQLRLAERLTRLADLALDHCEHVLTQPPGHWNDAKSNSARMVVNSLIRIMELSTKTDANKEGTTYENIQPND